MAIVPQTDLLVSLVDGSQNWLIQDDLFRKDALAGVGEEVMFVLQESASVTVGNPGSQNSIPYH